MSTLTIRPRRLKRPSIHRSIRENMVPETSSGARFLPHGALKQVLTDSVIVSILEESKAILRTDIPQLASFIKNRALKLFAILAWSDLGPLIEQFYEHNFGDDRLPVQFHFKEEEGGVEVDAFTFRSNGLNAITSHPFNREEWTERALDHFSEIDQWLFDIPIFHSNQFRYALHERCLMPFVDEECISMRQSYFSVLEQRRIHRDHLQMGALRHMNSAADGHPSVAIKEMKRMHMSDAEFAAVSDIEADALETLREIDHPHLIKALAYYTRGYRRFIMYPWAQGNLQDYWETDPPPLNQSYISWVFAQLCGLSDGIHRLHTYRGAESSFRHGDIKPENILFFSDNTGPAANDHPNNGMFVIADIGLSRKHLQVTELRKTATRTKAGTIMYEPPETEIQHNAPRSRRFDIWSIGCIFLEFTTWLLYGTKGLKRFRDDLYSTESPRFYTIVQNRNTRANPAHLNVVVRQQLDFLRHDPRCSYATAVRRLVDLIEARLLVMEVFPDPQLTSAFDEYGGTVISESVVSPSIIETSASTGYFGHSDASTLCRASSEEMCYMMSKIFHDASSKLVAKIDWVNWNVPAPFSYAPDRYNHKGERLAVNRTIKHYENEFLYPPLNDDWEYNHDFDMARYIFSDAKLRATLKLRKQPSELCQQCSSLRLWRPAYTFLVEKFTLTDGSQTCELCRLLFRCVQQHTSNVPTEFQFFRVGSFITYEDQKGSPIISMYSVPTAKALENEPTASDIQIGFPTLPEAGDSLHTKVIMGWIQSCNDKHQCYTRNTDFFPTRILDVDVVGSPEVKLVCDTKSLRTKGSYLALSHQWGPPEEHERFCTYTEKVEQFEESIKVDDLPKTFRDAVYVTRSLEIGFLWIDSLCIIQDSQEDWNAESKLMEHVFSSAYATIAASCAHGTNDGFLKPRIDRQSVTLTKEDGSPYYLCDAIDNFQADVELGELSKRGWVLQERALSRRTIYFTENQTYWECGGGVRCETLARMNNRKASFLGDANFPNSVEMYVKARKIELCQGLYERYSNLALSFEADRPIAIKGLEARLISTLNTVGGYGMFECYLHRCLLWRRSGDTLKRIESFRGETVPSWSWMAYTGGICYMNVPFGEGNKSGVPVINAQAWDLVDPEEHILFLDEPNRTYESSFKCVIVGTSKGLTSDQDLQSASDQEHTYYVLIISLFEDGQPSLYKRVGVAELEQQHIGMSKHSIPVSVQ